MKDLLEEIVCNTNFLPVEHKATASILPILTKEEQVVHRVDLEQLLATPHVSENPFPSRSFSIPFLF